jgi:hypothetical protein
MAYVVGLAGFRGGTRRTNRGQTLARVGAGPVVLIHSQKAELNPKSLPVLGKSASSNEPSACYNKFRTTILHLPLGWF